MRGNKLRISLKITAIIKKKSKLIVKKNSDDVKQNLSKNSDDVKLNLSKNKTKRE